MSEGAAAGSDGMNVEHGNTYGDLGDNRFACNFRPVFIGGDKSNIGRGAAHVEADDVVEAGNARNVIRADDTSGGSG